MTEQTVPPTITVTAVHVEAALRKYLAWLDYDLHKGIECGEEDGADTYPEEAGTLLGHLRTVAQAAPADVTVFELRAGTDAEPDHVATYATEQGAAAHGEHLYRAACGTLADLEWRPTGTDDNPRYRLVAVDDLDGDETDTDWHIVQVTVPGAFTPAGGEGA